jgi:hypothetical protein
MKVASCSTVLRCAGKDTDREQDPEAEIFASTARGYGARENVQLCSWKSALKGKPQGWDRHETRPAESGWIKASRV